MAEECGEGFAVGVLRFVIIRDRVIAEVSGEGAPDAVDCERNAVAVGGCLQAFRQLVGQAPISSYTPSPCRTSKQAIPAAMEAGLPAMVPA